MKYDHSTPILFSLFIIQTTLSGDTTNGMKMKKMRKKNKTSHDQGDEEQAYEEYDYQGAPGAVGLIYYSFIWSGIFWFDRYIFSSLEST